MPPTTDRSKDPLLTDWGLVQAAAEGRTAERESFARCYLPMARAYFSARWRRSRLQDRVEDAVQDLFAELFRLQGPLSRVHQGGGPRMFRRFLHGVMRNIARRLEKAAGRAREQQAASSGELVRIEADDAHLSRVLDRAWATAILREAAARQAERAHAKGAAALRRVELLQLRFRDGLPIREIARRWQVPASWLHGQYRTARAEFVAALREAATGFGLDAADEIERQLFQLYDLVHETDLETDANLSPKPPEGAKEGT